MLLGFKKQFESEIISGRKIHTVRNTPKHLPKIGDFLHMYTGLRTNNAELICRNHTLHSIQDIRILIKARKSLLGHKTILQTFIHIDGRSLTIDEQIEFSLNDGFNCIDDMSLWFIGSNKKKLKYIHSAFMWVNVAAFSGKLFHWTDLKY